MRVVIFESGAAKWVHKHSHAQADVIWTSNRSQALVLDEPDATLFVEKHFVGRMLATVVIHAANRYNPYSQGEYSND